MLGPLPPAVGGITTFIKGISESELNKKYNLILFGTERPTFRVARDCHSPILVFRIGLTLLLKSIIWTMSHLLMFPFVLLFNRPDIVHIHTASYWSFWENTVYCLISRLLHKKVIVHIHGGLFHRFYENNTKFVRLLIRKVLNVPDTIIVLSSRWRDSFMGIIPEDRIVVLENFVDLSRFAHFNRELNLSDDFINVLFVGGVGAKAKGLYDVLQAIPIVVKEYDKITFSFVACGDTCRLGLTGNKKLYSSHAKFLDYVSGGAKIKVFTTSDIFVLPSRGEGLPIAMLEAMAAGLPVIATPVGSIPEVIEEGKNGFLVEPGDYKSLAGKILILAKDKKLRRKMATNNTNKIRKRYDRPIVTRKLDNLYTRLLDK